MCIYSTNQYVANLVVSGRSLKSLERYGLRVRQIACGHAHTVMLTDSGEVWSCGSNDKGQCGQDTSTTRPGQYTIHTLTLCNTVFYVEVCIAS